MILRVINESNPRIIVVTRTWLTPAGGIQSSIIKKNGISCRVEFIGEGCEERAVNYAKAIIYKEVIKA